METSETDLKKKKSAADNIFTNSLILFVSGKEVRREIKSTALKRGGSQRNVGIDRSFIPKSSLLE